MIMFLIIKYLKQSNLAKCWEFFQYNKMQKISTIDSQDKAPTKDSYNFKVKRLAKDS